MPTIMHLAPSAEAALTLPSTPFVSPRAHPYRTVRTALYLHTASPLCPMRTPCHKYVNTRHM